MPGALLLISCVALLAGMAGGAQRAALAAQPDQLAAAVCAYAGGRAALVGSGRLNQARQLGLTGRQAANAKTIVDVAAELGLPERAAIIGMATALQESGLDENAVGDHGRAFGLMQQHPEYGWGSREQVTDPRYAARAFFSRLARVEGWAGKPLTVVAQAVQRSAHPDAYARHEGRAGQIVTALTSTAGPRNDVPKSVDDRDNIEAAAPLGMPLDVLVGEVAANLGGRAICSPTRPTHPSPVPTTSASRSTPPAWSTRPSPAAPYASTAGRAYRAGNDSSPAPSGPRDTETHAPTPRLSSYRCRLTPGGPEAARDHRATK
ncbi:hypothetical protein Misp02_30500 [Microtetraspora sp. NBRC 16547]|nr:hypothetical protein [Microtetraspora sp. NBRC 16547]GLW98963.1 hypothetical protein Misp02_30500 [Microtetraspora sp. NBRC 16547]